jgi:deazaflavin-dependent oxidoreductase (nitroreductase family)
VSTWAARYIANPIVRRVAGRVPWWVLLETRGRKSGRPRQNPVGNGLEGDTLWVVAEHGHGANYVKNIKADPRVRVRVGGLWRHGVAHILEDDDPRERQRTLGRRFNGALVRLAGTDLLTVRIDLEPVSAAEPQSK